MPDSQTVIITGAAGAVGSATAQRFEEAGWQLALLDVGGETVDPLRDAHPDSLVVDADLTDADIAGEAVAQVRDTYGSVDALLNIAGGFEMESAVEAQPEDLATMHQMNVVTLFNATRAALPVMQAQGHGFVLGVSAGAADDGAAGAASYAASKAGVAAYLKSVHAELQNDGIRTTVLYPMGVVDTPANRNAMPDADSNDWISRSELADHMLHLATRGQRGHVREVRVFADSA